MSCSASSSPTAACSRMGSSLLLPLPPRLAAKGCVLSNIAVGPKGPTMCLIDLISRDHVESESEGCQAGTRGRFSETDDLYGTPKPFFT